jgi:hypothetical protein
VRLEQIADDASYKPVPGREHCPQCWPINEPLRREPHHNAVGVFVLVCDGCGFNLVI